MRTVLLGTDFTYTSTGQLKPIEINTNVGMENFYLENDDDIYNLSNLSNFITQNNFTKVCYIGILRLFDTKLSELCNSINIAYEFLPVMSGNLTIPYIEDSNDILIIRSAYDTTAIVDDVYCKDKVNFLKMIQGSSFGSEFAYMDEYGTLISTITTITDNGNNPNFILKSVLPNYDKTQYPKLYKVSNQDELNIILNNVNQDYFLMPYYYNESKLYENQVMIYRSLNILFPPNLESIFIGSYKKFSDRKNEEPSIFDETTFELLPYFRRKYLTSDLGFNSPKLLDTDLVEMSDGTFKTPVELQEGDIIKSLIIPNPYNADLDNDLEEFQITYDEFVSGCTYTTNVLTSKKKLDRVCRYYDMLFTDGTKWGDVGGSSYIILENNQIRFKRVEDLLEGDKVVLIDTNSTELLTVLKEIETVTFIKNIFSGWELTVEDRHIFLTKTGSETNESFAAIEHNTFCGGKKPCRGKTCTNKRVCATTLEFSRLYCACY